MILQVVKELETKNNFLYIGGRGRKPQWGKFSASQEAIITLNICCKFQKDCYGL